MQKELLKQTVQCEKQPCHSEAQSAEESAKKNRFFANAQNDGKKGFTLAEVLITLSILGIIATVTIPNIIQHYQKRITVTKLQKAYVTLEKAAGNLMVNSDCVNNDIYCTGIFGIYNSADGNTNDKNLALNNYFIENSDLKIIKTYSGSAIAPKRLSSDTYDDVFAVRNISFTSDGIGYIFFKGTGSFKEGNKDIIVAHVFTEPKSIYSGSKKIINGRNLFSFMIYDNFQVQPVVNGWFLRPLSLYLANGSTSDIYKYCNPAEPDGIIYSGDNCAARIIYEGWKINY